MAWPKMTPFPHPLDKRSPHTATSHHNGSLFRLLLAVCSVLTTAGRLTLAQAQDVSVPASPFAFDCPSEGLFADEYDCRIYYRCELKTDDYIKPYMFACKAGTFFSRDLKLCMPPMLAGREECDHYVNEIDMDSSDDSRLMYGIANNGNAMAPNQWTNYGPSGLSGVSVISFSTSALRSAGSGVVAAEQGPPCEGDGFVSDPDDCTVFYRCISNGRSFNKIGFRCSDGTAWDKALQSCDHMHNVRANGGCLGRAPANVEPATAYADSPTTTQSSQANFQNTTAASSSSNSQQSSTSSSVSASNSSSTSSTTSTSSSSSSSTTSSSSANNTNSGNNNNNASNQQQTSTSTESNAANSTTTASGQQQSSSSSTSSSNSATNSTTASSQGSDQTTSNSQQNTGSSSNQGAGSTANGTQNSSNQNASTSNQSSASNQSNANNSANSNSQSNAGNSSNASNQSNSSSQSSQTGANVTSPDCENEETYIPDGNDCAMFYRCRDNGSGGLEKVPFTCGPGTIWNQAEKVCDFPTSEQKEKCKMSNSASGVSGSQQQSSASNSNNSQQSAASNSTTSSANNQASNNNQNASSGSQSNSQSNNQSSNSGGQSSSSQTSSSSSNQQQSNNQNANNNQNSTTTTTTQKPSNPTGECADSETYLPDKTDCGRFYRCVDNANGGFDKVAFDCAPGTVWDADLKGCNHPTDVQKEQCRVMASGTGGTSTSSGSSQSSASSTTQSGGTTASSTTETASTAQQTSEGSTTSSSGSTTTSSTAQSGGSTAINSTQSSSAQNQSSSGTTQSSGSSSQQTTTSQSSNNNQSSGATQSSGSSSTTQATTSTTGQSSSSSTATQSTQASQQNNNTIQKPPTQPAEFCESESTFLPDKENCSKFYRCVDNGKGGFNKVPFDCPPGTVWDAEANNCNHPAAVQNLSCKMVTTPSPAGGSQEQQGGASNNQSSSTTQSSNSGSSTQSSGQNAGQQSSTTTSQGSSSTTQASSTTGSSQSSGTQSAGNSSAQTSNSTSSQSSAGNQSSTTTTQGSTTTQSGTTATQGSTTSSGTTTQPGSTTQGTSSTQETTTTTQGSSSNQSSSGSQASGTTQQSSSTQSSSNNQSATSTQTSTSSSGSQETTTTGQSSSSNQSSNSTSQGSSTTQQSTSGQSSQGSTNNNQSNTSTQASTTNATTTGTGSGNSPAKPSGNCDGKTQFLGDDNDCAKFYRCVVNGNGGYDKVAFTCGPGTVWDQSIEACNHAWAIKDKNCGTPQQQPVGTPQPPTSGSLTTSKPVNEEKPTQVQKPTTAKPVTSKPEAGTQAPPASSSTTQRPVMTEGICRQDGFFGDPKDCTIFYRCVGNGKGGFTQYPFKCGDGTVWDNNLQTCNHDLNMCKPGGSEGGGPTTEWKPPATTTKPSQSTQKPTPSPTQKPTAPPTQSTQAQMPGYYPTTTQSPQSSTTDTGKDPEATTSLPVTTAKPIIPAQPIAAGAPCTQEGFFGDDQDCQKFYRCVDNGKGAYEKFTFTCGNNTVWDAQVEGCNHPTAVQDPRCRIEGSTVPEMGESTSTTTSGYYPTTTTPKYEGTTGDYTPSTTSTKPGYSTTTTNTVIPVTSTIPSTITEATESTTGEYTSTASPIPNLPPGTVCQGEGFMADPSDCRKFYRCVRAGDSYSRHEFVCSKGTGWSEEKQTCDYAGNIERCAGQVIAPEATTSSSYETTATTDKFTTNTANPSTTPVYEKPPTSSATTTALPTTTQSGTTTTVQSPTTTTQFPTTTTTQPSSTTLQPPATTTQPPATTIQPADTTVQPPITTSQPPTSTTASSAPTQSTITSYPTTTMQPTSTTPIPNLPPGTRCEGQGFMADPNNCRKFYRCVQNGSTFVRHEFTCAKGTGWSEEKQTCDYAVNIQRCDGQTEEPTTSSTVDTTTINPTGAPTTTTPSPTTTQIPTTIQGPTTTQRPITITTTMQTPETTPDASTQSPPGYQPTTAGPVGKPTTNYPTTPSTTEEYPSTTMEPPNHVCTSEGFFPDPEDCNRYYRCVDANQNGKYQIYSFRCPDGTVWDTAVEICNYPERVSGNCSTSPPVTTTTETSTGGSTIIATTGAGTEIPTTVAETTPTTAAATTAITTTITTTAQPTTASPTTGQPTTTQSTTTTTASAPPNNGSAPCPQAAEGQSVFVCPSGFRRHPKSCDLFYQCTEKADSHDLSVVVFECPNGTVYHEQRNLCDKPAPDDQCLRTALLTRSAFYADQVRRLNTVQVRSNAPLCPDEGHFALNKDECSQLFVKCSYATTTGRLEGHIYRCPQGFAYWAVSRRCERAQKLSNCTPAKYDISSDIPVEWANIGSRRRNLKI